MMEQRAMKRFDVKLPVRIDLYEEEAETSPILLWTTNVSADGAYLQTNTPPQLGTRVRGHIVLPFVTEKKELRNAVEVTGSVIRVEDNGMALSFDSSYQFRPIATESLDLQ
jgi:hypothetical protein